MIINYIYLKNIRSYKESKIFFPKGSTVLSGDIGSGKSSVLIALEFALFGFQSKRLSGSHLLRKGENEGIVEISLIIDGKDFIIKRILKKTKDGVVQTAGNLIDNGQEMDLTVTEIKSRVFDKLGYPKEHLSKSKNFIYRYTVYTPQEELKQILYEDSESRIESIRNIFQIDKYKNVKNNTLILIKKLKEKVLELKGRTFDLDEIKLKFNKVKLNLNNERKVLGMELGYVDNEKEKLSNILMEINKFKNIKNELFAINTKLEQSYDSKDNFNIKLNELSNKIMELENTNKVNKENELSTVYNENTLDNENELRAEIFKIQEQIAKSKSLKEIEFSKRENLNELNNIFNELNEEQNSLNVKIDSNRSKILKFDNLLKEKEIIDLKLLKEEKLFDEINEYYIKRKTELETLQNSTSKIMILNNCPTCLQFVSIDHKKSISANNNKQIIELKNTIIDLESKKQENFNDIKKLKIELNQFEEIKSNFSSLKNENVILIDRYKLNNNKKEDILNKIENLKSKLEISIDTSENKLSDFEKSIQEKNQLLETVIKNKQNKIKKLHLRELFELNLKLINENKNEYSKMEMDLKNINKLINELELKKNNLNLDLVNYEQIETEKNKIENDISNLNKSIAVCKNNVNTHTINLDELDHNIKDKENIKKRLEKFNLIISFLNIDFLNLTDNIEKHLFNTIQLYFDEYFSYWFKILIEDDNLLASIDDTFTPRIIQNGHIIDFTNLSGGEKTAICLAYRLALNKVINNLVSNIKTKNIIILDEPTEGFSSFQIDKIRDVLDELDLEQVIIVSHENKIESFVENVIYVKKQNHISEVSLD